MLSVREEKDLKKIVTNSLNCSEKLWIAAKKNKQIPLKQFIQLNNLSPLADNEICSFNKYKTNLFCALMIDVRDSTKHLRKKSRAKVSKMQRVYLELSALLPALEIGIGIASSKALIGEFGLAPNTQSKVIGECIYFASHFSKGRGEIIVYEDFIKVWQSKTKKDYELKLRKYRDFKGYALIKKS
jgi:hypothetical protein